MAENAECGYGQLQQLKSGTRSFPAVVVSSSGKEEGQVAWKLVLFIMKENVFYLH